MRFDTVTRAQRLAHDHEERTHGYELEASLAEQLEVADAEFRHFDSFIFASPRCSFGSEANGGESPGQGSGSPPPSFARGAAAPGSHARERAAVTSSGSSDGGPQFGDDRVSERIWRKLVVNDDGCWVWTGTSSVGYGEVRVDKKLHRVHRWVYSQLVRPVSADEHVHHEECRNTLCANPAHLRALLASEHLGHQFRDRTHCKQGHEWTPENTGRTTRGTRWCRACLRERRARLREGSDSSDGGPALTQPTPPSPKHNGQAGSDAGAVTAPSERPGVANPSWETWAWAA